MNKKLAAIVGKIVDDHYSENDDWTAKVEGLIS